jgi:hypothetical protein
MEGAVDVNLLHLCNAQPIIYSFYSNGVRFFSKLVNDLLIIAITLVSPILSFCVIITSPVSVPIDV